MAIVALTSMALWADLGLGNGLMTRLGGPLAFGDSATARRYVSTAYVTVGSIAAVLCILLWLTSPLVSWGRLVGLTDATLAPLATQIAVCCLTMYLVNVPVSLIHRVQYANRRITQSNLWQLAGSVLSVISAWAAVGLDAKPLIVILSAIAGPVIINVLYTIVAFFGECSILRPAVREIDSQAVRSMLQIGTGFLVLSIITSTALNIDSLIIAQVLGPAGTATYSVPFRVLNVLGLIVSVMNLPLWPAQGEALARRDTEWVSRTTTRMTLISGLCVLGPALVITAFGEPLIHMWLGGQLHVSSGLLAAMSLWWLFVATASPRFMVQNAGGVLLPQMLGWGAYLLTSAPLKWWALTTFGLAAVPLSGAILYLLLVWPAAHIGYRMTLDSDRTSSLAARGGQ